MNRGFDGKADTIAFRISTLDGSVYFVNQHRTLSIEENFVKIKANDLMLYETFDKDKKPVKGFIKVGQYLGMDDCIYVEMTGASISRVSSDTELGKAVIEARSGLVS